MRIIHSLINITSDQKYNIELVRETAAFAWSFSEFQIKYEKSFNLNKSQTFNCNNYKKQIGKLNAQEKNKLDNTVIIYLISNRAVHKLGYHPYKLMYK